MKYLFVLPMFLMISCHVNKPAEVPKVKAPIKTTENKIGIEVDIKSLKMEVDNISITKATREMTRKEKIEFHQSLSDLKGHINQAMRLMDGKITKFEKQKIEMSYVRAKEAWSYLLKTYKI